MADELTALLPVLQRLPHRLDGLAGALERGRLTANVRIFADEPSGRAIARLVDRAVLAFPRGHAGHRLRPAAGREGRPGAHAIGDGFEVLGYAGMFASTAPILRVVGIAQVRTL